MFPARAPTKSLTPAAAAGYAWVSMALSLATLVAVLAILRHSESLPSLW